MMSVRCFILTAIHTNALREGGSCQKKAFMCQWNSDAQVLSSVKRQRSSVSVLSSVSGTVTKQVYASERIQTC